MTKPTLVRRKSVWGEPFLVSSDNESHTCEAMHEVEGLSCARRSKWWVEIIGYEGTKEVPGQCPTFYVCNDHLTTVLEARR